ncbi:MAG: sulfurtransferase [Candidatus Eisenbacteria bacterium]|nr:sulfurtransferase [Candidatus Eisenbacteria bacterium]
MKQFANPVFLFGATVALAIAGLTGCSDSTTKPKETDPYPNTRLLISGGDLAANLTAANQVIVDTRSADAYAAGHIPGAISLPITPGTGLFDKGGAGTDATDLKAPAELGTVLGAAGLAANTTIVIYGTDIDWLVGRMFWMLEYIGASDVQLLDGGFSKWTADARQTSTTVATAPAKTFTPSVIAARLVDKQDVLDIYQDTADYAIVDSRNAADFQASRIPNAINILIGDFLNSDLTMKTSVEIDALLTAKGISRNKVIYTHCYVGYRSSQEYFVFRLMGYNVAHYDGSWAEWAADPNTPKASN